MLWRPVIMWIIKVQALSISNWRSLSWILVGSKLNFSLATVTNGFLDPKVPTQRHIGCNKILRNLRLQQKMVSLFWVYPSPTIPIIYMPGTPEKIDIGHKKKILMIHRKLLHQRQFFPRLPCSIFNLAFHHVFLDLEICSLLLHCPSLEPRPTVQAFSNKGLLKTHPPEFFNCSWTEVPKVKEFGSQLDALKQPQKKYLYKKSGWKIAFVFGMVVFLSVYTSCWFNEGNLESISSRTSIWNLELPNHFLFCKKVMFQPKKDLQCGFSDHFSGWIVSQTWNLRLFWDRIPPVNSLFSGGCFVCSWSQLCKRCLQLYNHI